MRESLHWLDGAARDLFATVGLTSLGALCAHNGGEMVTLARTRVCRRLTLGARDFYLKSQVVSPGNLPLRKWPSYLGKGSPLVREARNLARLQQLGILTPAVVCTGASRTWWGLPRRAVLITAALPGYLDLARLAREDRERAAALLPKVAAVMGGLHTRGLALGGLKLRNILIGPAGEIALLDLPDMGSASPRKILRDERLLAVEIDRAFPGGAVPFRDNLPASAP